MTDKIEKQPVSPKKTEAARERDYMSSDLADELYASVLAEAQSNGWMRVDDDFSYRLIMRR